MKHDRYYILVDYGTEGWHPWTPDSEKEDGFEMLREALEEWGSYMKWSGNPALVVKVIDPVELAKMAVYNFDSDGRASDD